MEQQASNTLTVREIVTALHRQSQCGAPEAFRQLAGAVSKAKINPTARGLEFLNPDPRQFASRLIEAAGCCGFDKDQIRCYSTGGLVLLAQSIGGEFRPLELLDLEIRKHDLRSATKQRVFPYAPEWSPLTDAGRQAGRIGADPDLLALVEHAVQELNAEGRRVTQSRVIARMVDAWSDTERARLGTEKIKRGARRGEILIKWKMKSGSSHVPDSTLRRYIKGAKETAGIATRNKRGAPHR